MCLTLCLSVAALLVAVLLHRVFLWRVQVGVEYAQGLRPNPYRFKLDGGIDYSVPSVSSWDYYGPNYLYY